MPCVPGTVAMPFNMVNPRAVKWAETRAAALVKEISEDTRAVIRSIVVDSFEKGVQPRTTARLIRATIGLTERDALAVARYRFELIEKGLDIDKALKQAEKYASELLQVRAETIARTETLRASNEGQKELWRQAEEMGLLDRRMKQMWIATEDACPECEELDGTTIGMDEDFDGPPLHPNCRCTIGLVE